MRLMNQKSLLPRMLRGTALAAAALVLSSAHAAAPGISGASGAPVFNLDAADMRATQPNGKSVYAWGYGCVSTSGNTFLPASVTIPAGVTPCPTAQMPGPTLIVTEGDTVTVNLTNNLPASAGATSILFPGFTVTSPTTGAGIGAAGLLTQEAPNAAACTGAGCNTVTYTFVAAHAGTHSYYSGTQGDVQVEMGLYGAIIVLPKTIPTACTTNLATKNAAAKSANGEQDFRLAPAAYNNASACYDREYLFQFAEMNDNVHNQVEQQVIADKAKKLATGTGCINATGCLVVTTEPYAPGYFLINGRSMPDDMDPNYAQQYPNQPYNGNPHMHPGELTLVRIIGQGRWQHPFHEHANHLRLLARDGNLLTSGTAESGYPAGPLLFTTTTTPGMTLDGIFYWTGKGLNWDVYGHGYAGDSSVCVPDANGYYTADPTASNFYEWCGDHNKALEKNPTGQVANNGPITLPDANIVLAGAWYSGSPYFGPDANARSVGSTPISPAGTIANSPGGEAGFAYMWHSHNEREITTDNVFPGGMMMMMLVDPRAFAIDESN